MGWFSCHSPTSHMHSALLSNTSCESSIILWGDKDKHYYRCLTYKENEVQRGCVLFFFSMSHSRKMQELSLDPKLFKSDQDPVATLHALEILLWQHARRQPLFPSRLLSNMAWCMITRRCTRNICFFILFPWDTRENKICINKNPFGVEYLHALLKY